MDVCSSTIREILVKSEAAYGSWDAFRYKAKRADATGKKETSVESKTYTDLKNDSEGFSAALQSLGEQKKHIAILGATSYEWIVAYMGIVNGGSKEGMPGDKAHGLHEWRERSGGSIAVLEAVG